MNSEGEVYTELCKCLIRELKRESPDPKIVECALKFVKDLGISTIGTPLEEELVDALPFQSKG